MSVQLLLVILIVLQIVVLLAIWLFRPGQQQEIAVLTAQLNRLQTSIRDEFALNRTESAQLTRANRDELGSAIHQLNNDLQQSLARLAEQQQDYFRAFEQSLRSFQESNTENASRQFREFATAQKTMSEQSVAQLERIQLQVEKSLSLLGESSKNDHQLMRASLETFSKLQREKFEDLEKRQAALMESNEKKLEEMRVTVDEKLQKTLQERLGQSFEIVGQQLERVQKGLGEMQVLAQDVGGLKRVLANVKMRGGIGEVQLAMLLEQLLAPDQYAANVKTKAGSSDHVEFAIKLPGREQAGDVVYLPVDAKFPAEVYQQLQEAFDSGDPALTELASRNLENTVKKMARDISEKYLDPPNTTDFAIMFLPFEGIYAEIVRKASLLELLQREYKIIVTGPTTLAAILNSLQMGFRTLALQRRSSEVWQTLSAVKAEFGKFGGLLEKAQKNLQQASGQLDELMGKRTRAIQRSLREVESLPGTTTSERLPSSDGDGEEV